VYPTVSAILQAEGLVKSYDGRRVVDGLSLECKEGEVLGLLGPNGAGKTTTLRMLYGFVEPEAGKIRVRGQDFETHRTQLKRLVGVCTQEDTLDYDFTVRQNLEVYASYFRPSVENVHARVDELLDAFGLDRYRNHSPHALSGGFKRRLLIARSVVHRPDVLYLDEPTTGLDPRARVEVWELIDALRKRGLAIILTTHYMDEAEKLSDRLLVISEGREVASGPVAQVTGELLGDHVIVIPPETEERATMVAFLAEELSVTTYEVLHELRGAVSTAGLGRFSERFGGARFDVRRPNLDDLFLSLALDPESASGEVDP
jgi:lipooligosaccharide transport system ATP-binding protein